MQPLHIRIAQCLMITAFVMIAGQTSAAAEKITVFPDSLIMGTDITLGKISVIEGSLNTISSLENIAICSAPLPKKTRTISRALILSRIRKAGFEDPALELKCPEYVTVTADHIEFSRADIEKIIKNHIYDNISWNKNHVDIQNIICKPVVLPKGRVSYSFNPDGRDKDFISTYNDEILFTVDNKYKKSIRISARIIVVRPVLATTRVIERNDLIQREDLILAPRDITACADHILTDFSTIIGKSAKTRINADTLIKDNMIGSAPAVKKGDPITIYLENPFMKLTAPGKALERGAVGETIKVANTASSSEIYAVVRNSKSVEVLNR